MGTREFDYHIKFRVGGNASSSSQACSLLLREGDSQSSWPETESSLNEESLVKNNGNNALHANFPQSFCFVWKPCWCFLWSSVLSVIHIALYMR